MVLSSVNFCINGRCRHKGSEGFYRWTIFLGFQLWPVWHNPISAVCSISYVSLALKYDSYVRGRGGSSSGSTSDCGLRGPARVWFPLLLGFFLSILFHSFNQWCVLNQVPRGAATLLVFNFPRKWKLSSAAWGKASLICTEWAKKKLYVPELSAWLALTCY